MIDLLHALKLVLDGHCTRTDPVSQVFLHFTEFYLELVKLGLLCDKVRVLHDLEEEVLVAALNIDAL